MRTVRQQPHARQEWRAATCYRGRKAARTLNMLFLADIIDITLDCDEPQAGNYHDVYELQTLFTGILYKIVRAAIPVAGLFLNADAGFNCKVMSTLCAQRDIQANIAENKKREQQLKEDDNYFDEELIGDELLFSGPMPDWIALKHFLPALKQKQNLDSPASARL